MKNNIFINILLVIFICAFLVSGYFVFIWVKSDRETKQLEEGLYSDVVTETKEGENEAKFEVDFAKLKDINEDVFAWIKIDGTYINYPILQGKTDEYYLRKDIYKKSSVSGSIFVDSSTNTNFEDDNTVIYGHNMKNQRMFANLHKIRNGSLGTDVKVEIYTPNANYIYKVFSAYNLEPNNDLIKKNFELQEDKEEYINKSISRSNVKFDVNKENINYENKIITLITCDSNNKRRVIVNAVREDEANTQYNT